MNKTFCSFRPSIIAAVCLLFSTAYSPACDCPPAPLLTKEYIQEKYKVVFYGKVTELTAHDGKKFVKFSVIEPYIGKLKKEMEIMEPGTDCSLGCDTGQYWIIYADYLEYGKAGSTICTPSRRQFANAADDYFTTAHSTTFEQDRDFLIKNFGIQPFLVKSKEEELLSQRELIKPKGFGMVWMILIGTCVLALFYYFFNRFFK